MMGNHSRLKNFVKKFIKTVRFGNDHFGVIMGYRDYVIGDSVISKVYYVEGLGHNLFFVGKFCDSDLEVAFRKHSCYVRDVDGVELLKCNRGSNLYTISVEDMMRSSLICLLSKASKNKSWLWHRRTPQQNDIVERRNRTLVEDARTMLIFSKALMFLWAEVVATAKFTALQEQIKLFRAENAKIKQHYKELYDSIKITRAKTIEKTTSLLTENEKLKAQLKGKMKCVTMDTMKPKVLAPGMYAIDVEPILPHNRNNREVHLDYLKHLKESVEILCEIVEEARIKQPLDNIVQKTDVHVIPSTGVSSFTEASGSKPRSNTKNNRTLPAKSDNKKKVEDHPRNNKSNLKQENHVDSSIIYKRTVVQIVLWYLDSGCSKHMTGNHSQLKNFMKKFIRTITFRNDHFGAIMGYGDYVIDLEVAFRKHSCYVRDVDGVELLKGYRGSNLYTIFVEDIMKSSPICLLSKASKNKSWLWHHRLNHLNFGTINDLARKDLQIQVGLNKTVRYISTDNGTEFVYQVLTKFYESVIITYQKSVPRTPQQNGVVKRRNRTLVEDARTMLIFSKSSMLLWAKAVDTTCYT
ncbi:retrovirus-related pol polyprotein from transposon TNT 1-94 [Tanacetum coccineum]